MEVKIMRIRWPTFCWMQGQCQGPPPSSSFSLEPPLNSSCPLDTRYKALFNANDGDMCKITDVEQGLTFDF